MIEVGKQYVVYPQNAHPESAVGKLKGETVTVVDIRDKLQPSRYDIETKDGRLIVGLFESELHLVVAEPDPVEQLIIALRQVRSYNQSKNKNLRDAILQLQNLEDQLQHLLLDLILADDDD